MSVANETWPARQESTTTSRLYQRLKRVNWIDVVAIVVLGIIAVLVFLPFLWMFSTSLRPANQSYDLPPAWLPTEWRWKNYRRVFDSDVPVRDFAVNSVKITVIVVIGQLISCSMAGFAFARLRFPFRGTLFILLLASL